MRGAYTPVSEQAMPSTTPGWWVPARRALESGVPTGLRQALLRLATVVGARPSDTAQHPRPLLDAARVRPAPVTQIDTDDPVVDHFLAMPVATSVDRLPDNSPAVCSLRAAGVRLVVPLVSQGELVGLLNLGPRLSDGDYSPDDRALLNTLSAQAAPALRVAQLVREQQADARERERIEHELRVARLIQQTLLPRDMPALPGWDVAAHYQPARAVGGDFYDFLHLPGGRLGIVIGDVTDKGIPAALVMATTRSILRSAVQGNASPRAVLEHANALLCPDIPPNMFVTCFCAVLDTATGRLRFANAGHDLPYQRHDGAVKELRARGMPLGLMPDMCYEEGETVLSRGDSILLYSDGLVEAHNTRREMFGFAHLAALLAELPVDQPMIDPILATLGAFTGPAWEQEDDVTLVTIQRQCCQQLSSTARASSIAMTAANERGCHSVAVPAPTPPATCGATPPFAHSSTPASRQRAP